METKVPRGALRIVETGEGCHALTEYFGEGKEKKPKLKMVAYSGGVIKDHWYWDNLAIDLKGIKFSKGKFPILADHDTSQKIAFSKDPIIDGKLEINPDKTQFVDTEASNEFQKLSADGFPYQCSIYAHPTVVERLEEGASVEVNGFTLRGPASVWRECEFKEASVCVFGWDSKTAATAFSREEVDIDMNETVLEAAEKPKLKLRKKTKEVNQMTLKEMIEKYPEMADELELKVKKQVDIESAKQVSELTQENADLKKQLVKEKDTNEKMTGRVLGLEKKDALRDDRELKVSADAVWTEKLAASELAESMYVKIRPHVTHAKFTEKGVLDVEAFGTAIEAEIQDWIDKGATSKVIGAGFTEKSVDENDELSEEKQESVDGDVNKLRKLVGQEPLKKETE